MELIQILKEKYPGVLKRRYGIEEDQQPPELLVAVAVSRNCIKKGNEADYSKAAALIVDEFRGGTLGRISLEFPEGRETVWGRREEKAKGREAEWGRKGERLAQKGRKA